MNATYVITDRAARNIARLRPCDRNAVVLALTREMLMGEDPSHELTALQAMAYAIIRQDMEREQLRRAAQC